MSSSAPPPLAPDEIARDATWLAQALDPAAGVVRLVAMDRDSYRAASFLDDRLMQIPVNAQLVPWPDVEMAIAGTRRTDARWIFHIGHVGSTLLSRLLGELDGVLSIREPRLLRDLALSPPAVRSRYIGPVPALMSRTFATDELPCIKATSFASQIAAELVPAGERALFLYARADRYVAGILAGENSVKELHMLAESRARRLAELGISLAAPRSVADLAAAAWATEMVTLEQAADAMGDRQLQWADFDVLLEDMVGGLAGIAQFFGFGAQPETLEALATGPLMSRYSKALEYEYSPGLREALLTEARARFGGDIDAALAMLADAAEKAPLLARALARTALET